MGLPNETRPADGTGSRGWSAAAVVSAAARGAALEVFIGRLSPWLAAPHG